MEKAKDSNIIIFMIDSSTLITKQIKTLAKTQKQFKEKLLIVVNKIDIQNTSKDNITDAIFISAKENKGIDKLKEHLLDFVNTKSISNNDTIVTNLRHYEELKLTLHEINTIITPSVNHWI